MKLLNWLVQLSRFGLAAMFLFAVGAKLFTLRDFAINISNLVWTGWAWPTAFAVILLEAMAAVLLIWPRTVRWGGVMAAALLLGFASYAFYYTRILQGEPLECGCFGGIIASQLGVSTALRNLGLILPALLITFAYRRTNNSRTREAPLAQTLAESE